MKLKLHFKQLLASATVCICLGAFTGQASALQYVIDDSCNSTQRATIRKAVEKALSLLFTNRMADPFLIPERTLPAFQENFGWYKDPQPDSPEAGWDLYTVLALSGFENMMIASFTPEKASDPSIGRYVLFGCNGSSFGLSGGDVALVTAKNEIRFTRLFFEADLIAQDSRATQAGTIIHEMVHVLLDAGSEFDYCKQDMCNAAKPAADAAARHDTRIFSSPSNYEYFYQATYPFTSFI